MDYKASTHYTSIGKLRTVTDSISLNVNALILHYAHANLNYRSKYACWSALFVQPCKKLKQRKIKFLNRKVKYLLCFFFAKEWNSLVLVSGGLQMEMLNGLQVPLPDRNPQTIRFRYFPDARSFRAIRRGVVIAAIWIFFW